MNQTVFSKEEVQMARKHMKKCSISLTIKESASQNHGLRFYFSPIGIVIIKNTNKGWQGCRKKEPSYTVGGNVN
jgi:hypothetical protein